MGIHRASLYVAFGDKQRLFLSVLDRYRQMVVRKLLDILDSCPSGRAAIATVVEHVISGGPLRGCLITNSAVERGLSDPATAKKVSLCLTQLEDGFYATLLHAQRGGELDQRRLVATPDGTPPPFYRIAEVYFPSLQALQACAESAGGQETVAHTLKISSGGAPVFLVAEEQTFTFGGSSVLERLKTLVSP